MYNKFHNANCSHGYGEPIWITICIQSADKNRHDESRTRGPSPTYEEQFSIKVLFRRPKVHRMHHGTPQKKGNRPARATLAL